MLHVDSLFCTKFHVSVHVVRCTNNSFQLSKQFLLIELEVNLNGIFEFLTKNLLWLTILKFKAWLVLFELHFTDIFVWRQNKVESKMDETKDHRAAELGDTEEASAEERRLVSEEVLHAPDVLHAGNCECV